MHELPLQERMKIWFQQDGAAIHSTVNVRVLLEKMFNGKVIHRYSDIFWPPRSADLTPLDFFLWGHLKQQVYQRGPFDDVDHLEGIISEECQNITPNMIQGVIKEFKERTIKCLQRQGGYVEALVD